MKLKSYIDLYALLAREYASLEERRAFGLEHASQKHEPLAQLAAWTQAHEKNLERPKLSERFDTFLYTTTLILVASALILGIFSGVALLSYNGKAPVNLVYFLAMVVFLPLTTMTLTLFSMIQANKAKNLLVHVSPAFWMEKLIALFSKKSAEELKTLKINPLLANWIVIKRSQLIALAFSVGLLLALLGIVATKDVAFAWSTTLDISAERFHAFLDTLAFAWKGWLPSAVPSLELIEKSHYFRLGGELQQGMIENAALLGSWWKFLAMATLFYAIILRFFFYLFSVWGLKRALARSFLALDGAKQLLKDMNEPLITTQAAERELQERSTEGVYDRMVKVLDRAYDGVQGWALPKTRLRVLCDHFGTTAPQCDEAGGNNTLEADAALAKQSAGSILLFVKAWEPPTMDFMDYLQMLSRNVQRVTVVPIGTQQQSYKAPQKEKEVWARKLATLDDEKVWIKI